MLSDASVFPHLFNGAAHGSGVHRGFWTRMHNQFPIIRDIINRIIEDDPSYNKIYVTGHSLGGALAQAFYMNWNTKYPESSLNTARNNESALKPSMFKMFRETALKFFNPTIVNRATENQMFNRVVTAVFSENQLKTIRETAETLKETALKFLKPTDLMN